MGGVCETALRRSAQGSRLPGPLHAPRGSLERPPPRRLPRSGELSMERLSWPGKIPVPRHDRYGRGVHPPVPDPHAACRFPAHSLLRIPGEPVPKTTAGPVPQAALRHRYRTTSHSGTVQCSRSAMAQPAMFCMSQVPYRCSDSPRACGVPLAGASAGFLMSIRFTPWGTGVALSACRRRRPCGKLACGPTAPHCTLRLDPVGVSRGFLPLRVLPKSTPTTRLFRSAPFFPDRYGIQSPYQTVPLAV